MNETTRWISVTRTHWKNAAMLGMGVGWCRYPHVLIVLFGPWAVYIGPHVTEEDP